MVGILLITHNGLGHSLLDCVRHVTGKEPANLLALSVLADDDTQAKEAEAVALIKQLDTGDGVLLLTDMFGATPANIACRLYQPGQIEGIAGVNLPMLLRVVCGPELPLHTLMQKALLGGQDCIVSLQAGIANCQDCS
jgi:PTS system mannose-specific IIA component